MRSPPGGPLPRTAGADEIADLLAPDVRPGLGEIVIRHARGEIRVETDKLGWWGELDEATACFFAERLAAISEDAAAILACVDGEPDGRPSTSYRSVTVVGVGADDGAPAAPSRTAGQRDHERDHD